MPQTYCLPTPIPNDDQPLTASEFLVEAVFAIGSQGGFHPDIPVQPTFAALLNFAADSTTDFWSHIPVLEATSLHLWGTDPHEECTWSIGTENNPPPNALALKGKLRFVRVYKGEFHCEMFPEDVDYLDEDDREQVLDENDELPDFIPSGVVPLAPGIQLHIVRHGSESTSALIVHVDPESEDVAEAVVAKYGIPSRVH